MADSPRLADLPDGLPGLPRKGPARRRRVPSQAVRRIRVVERPGADFAAPEHDLNTIDCWCEPILESTDDDAVFFIHHRGFEN